MAINKNEQTEALLKKAVEALDDYLNAGCKKTRKEASKKAKEVYSEYYGIEYFNRNERKQILTYKTKP